MVRKKELISTLTVENVERVMKTTKEWIDDGLKSACYAEGLAGFDKALKHLNIAHVCFENAGSEKQKAKYHRESLQLRKDIYYRESGASAEEMLERNDERTFKEAVASTLTALVHEDLLQEAVRLWKAVAPFLDDFSREKLEQRLILMLPFVEEEDDE